MKREVIVINPLPTAFINKSLRFKTIKIAPQSAPSADAKIELIPADQSVKKIAVVIIAATRANELNF